jgi:hypothetical protein
MMSALEELQLFFAGTIQRPVRVAEQPEALGRTPGFIAGNDRLSPTAQLEIYREQFWLRHVDALAEDFATLHHLLGHDDFTTFVERYIETHPPTDFSLRDLGAKVSAFVASHPAYRDDTLLLDCARLEWAFVDAFDAADVAPLDPLAITSVPEDAWDAARLSFHPSMQPLALGHGAHEYRELIRKGEDPPRPVPAPVRLVVYRGPETLQYIEIEPLAFDLLERLARGEALGKACETIAASAGDAGAAELEEKVGGWFQQWAAFGWISAIVT